MNQFTLTKIVALGALTGMRSLAGVGTLAWAHPGVARTIINLAAVGELVADKTSVVGDRIAPLPLAGRGIMGAVVGAVIARDQQENALLGAMLGAASALVATHVAYYARRRLPLSSVAGGLLEDGIAFTVASRYAT